MATTLFRSAVNLIIRDEAGKTLLHRRSNTGYMDGYYDFPGGHLEASESFVEAAVRELAEETGLIVRANDLEILHINQNYLSFPYVVVMFTVKKWQGIPRILESDYCDDLGFFPVEALPEKCTLAVRVVEQSGWLGGPHLTKITSQDFEKLIGVTWQSAIIQDQGTKS